MVEIKSIKLSELSIDNFKSMLNKTFTCSSPIDCTFELSEVNTRILQNDHRVTRSPFSVIFKTPASISPVQGIFQLSHQDIGCFSLFLVPVEKVEDSILFEASFT